MVSGASSMALKAAGADGAKVFDASSPGTSGAVARSAGPSPLAKRQPWMVCPLPWSVSVGVPPAPAKRTLQPTSVPLPSVSSRPFHWPGAPELEPSPPLSPSVSSASEVNTAPCAVTVFPPASEMPAPGWNLSNVPGWTVSELSPPRRFDTT